MQETTALTSSACPYCCQLNTLDNRAPKCKHYCRTCASTERRLPQCKEHPAPAAITVEHHQKSL